MWVTWPQPCPGTGRSRRCGPAPPTPHPTTHTHPHTPPPQPPHTHTHTAHAVLLSRATRRQRGGQPLALTAQRRQPRLLARLVLLQSVQRARARGLRALLPQPAPACSQRRLRALGPQPAPACSLRRRMQLAVRCSRAPPGRCRAPLSPPGMLPRLQCNRDIRGEGPKIVGDPDPEGRGGGGGGGGGGSWDVGRGLRSGGGGSGSAGSLLLLDKIVVHLWKGLRFEVTWLALSGQDPNSTAAAGLQHLDPRNPHRPQASPVPAALPSRSAAPRPAGRPASPHLSAGRRPGGGRQGGRGEVRSWGREGTAGDRLGNSALQGLWVASACLALMKNSQYRVPFVL